MISPENILTARLELIASTAAMLEAEMRDPKGLTELVDADVPDGWPPGEYDAGAMKFFRDQLLGNPDGLGWYGWYAILRGDGRDRRTLVGSGGFFGPPNADGVVEIGYSVVHSYQRRGFASELVEGLILRAVSGGNVKRVIAHTRPENIASVRVLEKAGLTLVGSGSEAGTIEFSMDVPRLV
jgi:[ribosomal protein S5]-alanine N-acetyltransferase